MSNILIVESNTPELLLACKKANRPSAAEIYQQALKACDNSISCDIYTPYSSDFRLNKINWQAYQGIVFTGSGVSWCVDAPEAQILRQTMEAALSAEKPILGSCNGLQLGNLILGGSCGAAPKGMEIGLAVDLCMTPEGLAHAFHRGRAARFSALCVHRDHVTKIPAGAIITVGNAHSPVQGMVYERGNTRFWGVQYHPEMSLQNIIDTVSNPDSLFTDSHSLLVNLRAAHENPTGTGAFQLGANGDDLKPEVHRTELANWLLSLNDEIVH